MEWITTTQVLEDMKASKDASAWGRFERHFFPVVVSFAKRLGLSQADAEDAAQETMLAFLKAFRSGRYDREKGRLSHWLFGVARNAILNFRRRAGRDKLIADQTAQTGFWDRLEDENAVRHTWTVEWQRMVILRCLERARQEFDAKTFEAFELFALSEKPIAEVMQRLNMSRNAIYIAKSRVLSRLRQLEQEFEGSGPSQPS